MKMKAKGKDEFGLAAKWLKEYGSVENACGKSFTITVKEAFMINFISMKDQGY
jgi:hypothetical protein